MAKHLRRWHLPVAALALIAIGDFELRKRDSTAALGGGGVDVAILLELSVYCALAAVLFLTAPSSMLRPSRLLRATWAFVLVLALSGLWSPSIGLGMSRATQLVATMLLAHTIAVRMKRTQMLYLADLYCAMVTVWIAIGLVLIIPQSNEVAGRFAWFHTHPVTAGAILSISSLLLLHQAASKSRTVRTFPVDVYRLLAVVHFAALAATQTRGSGIAFFAGVVIWAYMRVPRRDRRVLLGFAAVLLPVGIVATASVVSAYLVRGEGLESLLALNSRLDLWTEAWRAVAQKPILGQGYFSSRELFLDTIGLGGAHNAYIEVAISAGLVGCVMFALFVRAVFIAYRVVRSHPDAPLVVALFVVIGVNGLTAQYAAQAGTASNVWLLLAVAWLEILRRDTVRRNRARRLVEASSTSEIVVQ